MKDQILMAGSGGLIFFVWIVGLIISGIVSSNKSKQIKKQSQLNQNMQANRKINPQQPNLQRTQPYQNNIPQQQMANNTKQSQLQNGEYVPNEYVEEYVPDEQVEEYVPSDNFEEYVPSDNFKEYVPEEMGEKGSILPRDNFYSKMETVRALNDEEDIAREKAYQRKTQNAFAENKEKHISRSKKLFSGNLSLKKAILISEVLGKPKAMEE